MSATTVAGSAGVEPLSVLEYTAYMTRGGIAVLLVLGGIGCGAPPPVPQPQAQAQERQDPSLAVDDTEGEALEDLPPLGGFGMAQELEDVTFRQTRGTATEWELHAAKVHEVADAPAHLERVTLRYFGNDAEPTLITAAEAEYDIQTKSAVLRGAVRIETPSGDSLESEELYWNAAEQMLNTEVEVTLRRGGSFITGMGLKTSPGLEDVELFQVHGIVREDALAG